MAQVRQKQRTQTVETKASTSVTDSLVNVGSDTWKNTWDELLNPFGKTGSKFLEQIYGSSVRQDGDLHVGEVIELKKKSEEKAVRAREGHMEYFRKVEHADSFHESREQMEVKQQVEQIRMEIKQLLKTSKQLETTFKAVAQDTKPVSPGKYHLNFFDWVLTLLRSARVKMEEGLSWANVAKGKKQQKQYWNMFKKHGTTFGLSHERTVATQTG